MNAHFEKYLNALFTIIMAFLRDEAVPVQIKCLVVFVAMFGTLSVATSLFRSLQRQALALARGGLHGWYEEVAGNEFSVNQRLTQLQNQLFRIRCDINRLDGRMMTCEQRLDDRERTVIDFTAEVINLRRRLNSVAAAVKVEEIEQGSASPMTRRAAA